MTMKVNKGLESPVVALAGVGHMPAKSDGEQEAARGLLWRRQWLSSGLRWRWRGL